MADNNKRGLEGKHYIEKKKKNNQNFKFNAK